jgi:hypothetical protein
MNNARYVEVPVCRGEHCFWEGGGAVGRPSVRDCKNIEVNIMKMHSASVQLALSILSFC